MKISILKLFGKDKKKTEAVEAFENESLASNIASRREYGKCYASAHSLICGGIAKVLPGNKKETMNLVGHATVKAIINLKTDEIESVTYEGITYSGGALTPGRLSIIERELKVIEHAYSGESYFTLSDLGKLPSSLCAYEGDIYKQFFMLGINTVEIRSKIESGIITSIKVNGKMIADEEITIDVINEVRKALGKSPKGEEPKYCTIRG